jgi:hypothetical protein
MDWLKIILGAVLAILGAVFAAMMTVPEATAAANLRTYWEALGFSATVGFMMGLAIAIAGVILAVVSWRNKYRKLSASAPASPAPVAPPPATTGAAQPQRSGFSGNTVTIGTIEKCKIGVDIVGDATDNEFHVANAKDCETVLRTNKSPEEKTILEKKESPDGSPTGK